jgi:predicted dinucleotide-binding enzyme
MRIAIIGAGNVGTAVGKAWAAAGHAVVYGVRNPADPKHAALGKANVTTPPEAAAGAEIVVLSTPWNATIETARSLGNLAGKIVLDCTNPLAMGADGLNLAFGHTTSAGEQVAEAIPGAAVFKTLNQTGSDNMAAAKSFPTAPAMFVAGDDAAKKPVVMGLLRDLGFEGLDAGPLRNSRLLEAYAMLWIDQAMKRGGGRNFAFAIARRS